MLQIELCVGESWPKNTDWQMLCDQAARAALGVSPHSSLLNGRFTTEISVKFSDNDEVQDLNRSYRGKDKPTNILSFPLVPIDLLSSLSNTDDGEVLLGDMILAQDVCQRESKEKKIALTDHLSHLVVHGTLHLLGYDHESETDANVMEDLEVRALGEIGIANPYADGL